mgnify:CR=1 FL=1
MRRDRRTREQRKADASARIAAVCLFLAVLLILFAVLTVKTTGQPYKGEPPVIEDKLPGEDKPATEYAYCDDVFLGEFTITYYCACRMCCGKEESDPNYGITATGTLATEGRTVAVDPSVIPYGTEIRIIYPDGEQCTYISEDRGGAIKGNRIDVFMETHEKALKAGIKTAEVFICGGEKIQ